MMIKDTQVSVQWLRHYQINGSYVSENNTAYVWVIKVNTPVTTTSLLGRAVRTNFDSTVFISTQCQALLILDVEVRHRSSQPTSDRCLSAQSRFYSPIYRVARAVIRLLSVVGL